jgi:hypothetical protein
MRLLGTRTCLSILGELYKEGRTVMQKLRLGEHLEDGTRNTKNFVLIKLALFATPELYNTIR